MHTASTLDRASLQMLPFRELRYCSELQMLSLLWRDAVNTNNDFAGFPASKAFLLSVAL